MLPSDRIRIERTTTFAIDIKLAMPAHLKHDVV
jgi:hypothetical protein